MGAQSNEYYTIAKIKHSSDNVPNYLTRVYLHVSCLSTMESYTGGMPSKEGYIWRDCISYQNDLRQIPTKYVLSSETT